MIQKASVTSGTLSSLISAIACCMRRAALFLGGSYQTLHGALLPLRRVQTLVGLRDREPGGTVCSALRTPRSADAALRAR